MDAATKLKETILTNLRSRVWRAGERLPTERALSLEFGLSRSTVRRVLLDFKRKLLITQTVGSGTYVSEQVHEVLTELAPNSPVRMVSPADLLTARLAIEPAMIELAVGNATDADFERMDHCNANAETATSPEAFEQWDAQLHEAIALSAHNGFITAVFRLVTQARDRGEWGVLKRRSATPERRIEYQHEHRALVAALKDRDVERARELCRAHLIHVRVSMLGY